MRQLIEWMRVVALAVLVAAVAAQAASAGSGGAKTGQACYKGAYTGYLDPSTGTSFASQTACVSFVAKGGVLVPAVDLGLSFVKPGTATFGETWADTGDLVVHNYGSRSETFAVHEHFDVNSAGVERYVAAIGLSVYLCGSIPSSDLVTYDLTLCSVGTIAPGQSLVIQQFGAEATGSITGQASISSAQYADPVTSNNSINISVNQAA
jgi:hypothetical protein